MLGNIVAEAGSAVAATSPGRGLSALLLCHCVLVTLLRPAHDAVPPNGCDQRAPASMMDAAAVVVAVLATFAAADSAPVAAAALAAAVVADLPTFVVADLATVVVVYSTTVAAADLAAFVVADLVTAVVAVFATASVVVGRCRGRFDHSLPS